MKRLATWTVCEHLGRHWPQQAVWQPVPGLAAVPAAATATAPRCACAPSTARASGRSATGTSTSARWPRTRGPLSSTCGAVTSSTSTSWGPWCCGTGSTATGRRTGACRCTPKPRASRAARTAPPGVRMTAMVERALTLRAHACPSRSYLALLAASRQGEEAPRLAAEGEQVLRLSGARGTARIQLDDASGCWRVEASTEGHAHRFTLDFPPEE